MSKPIEPSFTDFYEELPATAEAEATVTEDESTAESELENDDSSFEDLEDEEDSEEHSEDETEEESDPEDESADEQAEEESQDDPEAEESKEMSEEQRKAHNHEMAQRRLKEKAAKEQSVKDRQQEYVEGAEDARDRALRELQVDAYNTKVERNSGKLENGYVRALNDFEILRDPSPEVQRFLDEALDAYQAQHVTFDQYENPVSVGADLYTYLQRKADSIKALTGKGVRQQIQAKGKEKSKTFAPPNRAPKEAKPDPLLDAFDEEASR